MLSRGDSSSQKINKPKGPPLDFLKKVQYMEKFPESLKKYVNRCFAQCNDSESVKLVSNHLLERIEVHKTRGSLTRHNWNEEPLVISSENEKSSSQNTIIKQQKMQPPNSIPFSTNQIGFNQQQYNQYPNNYNQTPYKQHQGYNQNVQYIQRNYNNEPQQGYNQYNVQNNQMNYSQYNNMPKQYNPSNQFNNDQRNYNHYENEKNQFISNDSNRYVPSSLQKGYNYENRSYNQFNSEQMNDYQSQPTNDQAMRFNRPPENIRSNSKKFDDRRPLNRYTHNERSQQYNDNQKRDFGYDDENYDNRKPLNRYASNESEQYDNRRDNEQSQQYNDNQKRGFGYYDENQFNSENRNYNQFNSEQMNNYQSQPTNDQVMRFNRPPENVRSDSEKFDDRRPLNRYTHNERSQQYNDNQKRDFGYDDENYSNQKRDFRYDDENYDNRKPLNRYANNESEQYDNRRDKKYTDNERSQQYNDNQKRGLGYNDKNYDNKRDVSAKYNNENRYSSDDENGYDHRNRNFFRYSDDDEYDRESDIGNEPNKQTKINKNKKFQKQKKTKPKKQNKVTQLPPLPKKLPLHKPIIKKEVEEPAPIVGTSTAMEKQYLRLAGNTLPDASNFRPLPILIQSFEYCLGKYEQNKDYEYISEQLRSIRQDLLVQHIENPFCVKVYEKHAHLAIMNEDWGNFNQSMTSLEKLYKMNFGEYENICEFFCYRIVYSIGVDDEAGLYSFIPRIPENVILSDQVQIALKIWKFSNTGEWVKFFEIMNNASDFLKKVMSIKAKQMRFLALSSSVKGMRKLSLEGFREFLFLQTIEETREYLAQNEVSIPE